MLGVIIHETAGWQHRTGSRTRRCRACRDPRELAAGKAGLKLQDEPEKWTRERIPLNQAAVTMERKAPRSSEFQVLNNCDCASIEYITICLSNVLNHRHAPMVSY